MTKLFTHDCRNTILCDRKIVFRKFFMRTKFCSTFFGFGRSVSKPFAYNFQHVCHKRNLRLSGKFFGEKLLILTNWLFYKTFRFLAKFFSDFWRKKLDRVVKTTFWTSGETFWAKVFFLRKLKISKFFGTEAKNFWVIGRVF